MANQRDAIKYLKDSLHLNDTTSPGGTVYTSSQKILAYLWLNMMKNVKSNNLYVGSSIPSILKQ